ncbi:hypothetical protein KOR34_04750 [Posidoniimonas corsicana]|uniref:Uncharacterized protein n=1 Tax=Posidoniimonas corsicana TaxID=1938618 RepID=A0A5C5VD06_9BACT|nr:hypothetical protein [Posidoniimonas corsicana]TWT35582.1 hypothetical protein KOR34_04750 [Posidoniimonas corsicana]
MSPANLPEPDVGGKHIRLLQNFRDALRGEGAYGNCRLFLDDVFVAYLPALLNSAVRSLQTIKNLRHTRQAQRHLTVSKVCKRTISDFNALCKPERLTSIIETIVAKRVRKEVTQPAGGAVYLHGLLQKTVAVDNKFLPAVAGGAWAIAERNSQGPTRHREG